MKNYFYLTLEEALSQAAPCAVNYAAPCAIALKSTKGGVS